MDIQDLRYFLAVSREENITRAAEAAHISQPALSRRLMDLEQELGQQLLVRGKRKITLTERGVLLRKRAEEILALVEKTGREVSSSAEQLAGELAVGGGASAQVAGVAARLARQYPGVSLYFFSGSAEDVLERVEHGVLDFGVLIEPPDPLRYESLVLPGQNYWGVLMRRDNPLAQKKVIRPEDLAQVRLIMHQRASLRERLAAWLGKPVKDLQITASYNLIYGNAMSLVKNGLGCALTLNAQVEQNGLCFVPLEPALPVVHYLVWKRGRVMSRLSGKFLTLLKEAVPAGNGPAKMVK